jgi:calmodulin
MEEHLALNQVTEFQQAFFLFDRKGDGLIPITELATVMRSLGQNPSYEEIEGYINEFDPD